MQEGHVQLWGFGAVKMVPVEKMTLPFQKLRGAEETQGVGVGERGPRGRRGGWLVVPGLLLAPLCLGAECEKGLPEASFYSNLQENLHKI